ncbi:MAG TPA: amidohydrolase family protein [Acidimicrobiia bacterium]|nr:amidohydrolase family protein [Acidimicrobiia bacterium]
MTRTVFTGGSVFDGTGHPPGSGDVVIEDGRVVDVGSGLDGDDQVDCSGRTILPGLFDTHVHFMISGIDIWGLLQTPISYRFIQAARNLAATLDAGITTTRDAGGADAGLRRAVDDGLIPGPRMQVSIGMLSQTGGHGDPWLASGVTAPLLPAWPGSPETIVDGPDEVRRKVRELIRCGADVIKVATSGGVLSASDEPTHAHLSPAELDVLIEEANAAGRFVMAHAQATTGIKNAIRAGVRSIEHGIYLDDEAIELMVERGTWLVPTLMAPRGVIAAVEQGARAPESAVRKATEVIEIHRESFGRAVSAGVKVATGTDTGVTPHGDNLIELGLMEQGGMSPIDVLVATTHSAAELMGLDRELGTLQPGKRADLVMVEGDPLDLKALPSAIAEVWKDGVRVKG